MVTKNQTLFNLYSHQVRGPFINEGSTSSFHGKMKADSDLSTSTGPHELYKDWWV